MQSNYWGQGELCALHYWKAVFTFGMESDSIWFTESRISFQYFIKQFLSLEFEANYRFLLQLTGLSHARMWAWIPFHPLRKRNSGCYCYMDWPVPKEKNGQEKGKIKRKKSVFLTKFSFLCRAHLLYWNCKLFTFLLEITLDSSKSKFRWIKITFFILILRYRWKCVRV